MLKKKRTKMFVASDLHDYYVKVTVPFNIENRTEVEKAWSRILWTSRQCIAYRAFIRELGYDAVTIKRTYSHKKSEGGYIVSEEPVRWA